MSPQIQPLNAVPFASPQTSSLTVPTWPPSPAGAKSTGGQSPIPFPQQSDHNAPSLVQVEWLNAPEEAAWDAFVVQHPSGSIYQQTSWRRVMQDGFPHLAPRILVLRDPHTRSIIGGTAVYLARSWLLGSRIVSVPFASHVDPLISDPSHLAAIGRFLRDHRESTGARTVELRLLHVPPSEIVSGGTVDRGIKHHHLQLSDGLEALFKKCSRSCVRQWIQKADKAGVTIRAASAEQDWNTFFQMYAETRRRLQLPVMPRRFFQALIRHLPAENRPLLLAEKDGVVLGAGLGLVFNGVFLLEWVGDSSAGRQVGANQRLYWAAVQEAVTRGYRTFSFGRTAATNAGLLEYKRRWGAIESDMPVVRWGNVDHSSDCEDVTTDHANTDSTTTRFLRGAARKIVKSAPPWLYYRFSEFCYRHLG